MASGSNMEPEAGSSKETVSSPGPEVAAAPGAGDDEAAAPAVSPAPAPATATAPARPYYECVFCKRGFSTAQALGGHMNIHRRDRAKPSRELHTPSGIGMTTSVSRNVECNSHLAPYGPYPPAPTTTPMSSGSSFATYYRGTGAATGVVDGGEATMSPRSASPRELSLFGAAARDHDLHQGLGCHGRGGDGSRAAPPEGSERLQAGMPERELDLELRLGRRPRH